MGNKLADKLSNFVGSWTYMGAQTTVFILWVFINTSSPTGKFDPFPFSFLNLFVGFMSAYTAPILLIAANRQSEKDRQKILESLSLDQKTEALTKHIDNHMHELKSLLEKVESRKG